MGSQSVDQETPGVEVPLPSLVLISDAARLGEDRFFQVLRSAVAAGLPALQVREPSWPARRLRRFVQRIQGEAGKDLMVFVNRATNIVADLGLDGLHVGGGDPTCVRDARTVLGEGVLIGYSAHTTEELALAREAGANYCYLSPVFAPLSKPATSPAMGLEGFRDACSSAPLPVYALGGIRPSHVRGARQAGACGVAVIGSILDATDPAKVTREFLTEWSV